METFSDTDSGRFDSDYQSNHPVSLYYKIWQKCDWNPFLDPSVNPIYYTHDSNTCKIITNIVALVICCLDFHITKWKIQLNHIPLEF